MPALCHDGWHYVNLAKKELANNDPAKEDPTKEELAKEEQPVSLLVWGKASQE